MIPRSLPSRQLLVALSLGLSLLACRPESVESQNAVASADALAPELLIDGGSLKLQEKSISLPLDTKLSAISSLSEAMGELGSNTLGLRIRFQPGVTAATLLRVLLSAQEAEIEPVHLAQEEIGLELLLPDAEQTPALPGFDLFVGVDTRVIYVSRDLSDLGEAKPEAPSGETGSREELLALLTQSCREGACALVALSMNADFPLQRLEPLLSALVQVTGGKARVRLLVAGVPQQAPVATEPRNSEFSGQAFALIEENRERFVRCQRLADPGSFTRGGTVMIRFVVTPLGLVFEAEAMSEESTIVDPKVERCVVETVSRLKFAKPPSGNEELRYLLRF